MKLSALVGLAAVGLVLASGTIGCKKNPGRTTPLPGPGRVEGTGPSGPEGGRQITNETTTAVAIDPNAPLGTGHLNWKEDRDTFSAQTIYFDLDKFVVKASEMPKVEAVATRL